MREINSEIGTNQAVNLRTACNVSQIDSRSSVPGNGYRYATRIAHSTVHMNGVEQNPYAPSQVVVPDTGQQSCGPRRSLRALQSLFLAVLFFFSFLFLGCLATNGITDAWNYTIFFVTEYPVLSIAIVLSNALLRRMLLPKLQARLFWLPVVGGVAPFCSFNWVWYYFDAFMIDLGLSSGILAILAVGVTPSFVGILVEGFGQGTHFIVKRNKSKDLA